MEKSTEEKPQNRRKSLRRKARSYIKLECRKGTLGLGANLGTILLDVSETGARMIVSQELPTKNEVEITFAAQGLKQPIKRIASIRWQLKLDDGKYCIGVEFEKRIPYADWFNLAMPS